MVTLLTSVPSPASVQACVVNCLSERWEASGRVNQTQRVWRAVGPGWEQGWPRRARALQKSASEDTWLRENRSLEAEQGAGPGLALRVPVRVGGGPRPRRYLPRSSSSTWLPMLGWFCLLCFSDPCCHTQCWAAG